MANAKLINHICRVPTKKEADPIIKEIKATPGMLRVKWNPFHRLDKEGYGYVSWEQKFK